MQLISFALKRAGQLGLTVAVLAVCVFVAVRIAPGGPAASLLSAEELTPERIRELERQLGLDAPLHDQLGQWLGQLGQGDFGASYFFRRSAKDVVLERLPATLTLGATSLVVALLIGVSAGVWAASRPGSVVDQIVSSSAVALLATPNFSFGLLLIVLFAAWLRLLPSSGAGPPGYEPTLLESLRYLILPAVTMAAHPAATLALYTRSATLEALASEYVRTARAKGLSARNVAWRHALPNATIPIVTLVGLQLPHLVEGSIVVEAVFTWPGIGALTVASVGRRDYPVLLVITLLAGVGVALASFLTDLAHHLLDPRADYR